MRETGIDIIGDVPWGTHFCQFYQTQDDLLDILVPYFKHGLKNNEYCMWVTSAPLQSEQAIIALRHDVPDLDDRIAKGQIEILDYSQWYTLGGKFDADRVLEGWVERETQALQEGYDGLRLTGNTFWLEKQDWNDFACYEAKVNEIIGNHKMLALCTYSLERCGPIELLDVVKNHQFAIAKRCDTWEVLESASNKKLEIELKGNDLRYRGLLNSIDAGYIHCQIVLDDHGHPVDFVFKDINNAYERMRNLRRAEVIDKKVTEVIPTIKEDPFNWIEKYGRVALTGEPYKYEQFSQVTNTYVSGYVYSPERGYFDVLFFDVTERLRKEEEIRQKNIELTRSNRDLEAFAFAASHDMQEPLRMVSSFVQLLADRYHGKLDAEADSYIQQVVNGTISMRNLVKALLDYSQIQNRQKIFYPVDMNEVLKQALSCLSFAIKESGAKITYDPLPPLQGDSIQLVEVLQNLIENSIKFRKENESPSIHIGVMPQGGNEWHFFVKDNGIGIDPKYIPKLFVIFKRLHARGKYPGTGVGLAMCKKIVERYNGRIWVESELGKGATFHFTLPKTRN